MAEYVEKAAFREHLDSVPPFTKNEQRDPEYDFAKTVFLSELASYPAADVAQVVRCKDCRHRDPEDKKCDSGMPERQGCPFRVADDYFCAYGER